MNKVLVTGLGMISPLGLDKTQTFAAALAGQSGISLAPESLSKRLPNLMVASITADLSTLLDKKHGGQDRATQLALIAAQEAMCDAKLSAAPDDAPRFGVYVGVGFGGAQTVDSLYTKYYDTLNDPAQKHKNPTIMHPLSVPRMMPNASAAVASMQWGLRGTSNTYSVACASSAVAIGEAYRAIRHGYLDAALVMGTEAMLSAGSLMAWNALRVMAKPVEADVTSSCRPFSLDRSGFVLGEGAAALVLESEARAHRRAKEVSYCYGHLCGYGSSSDADHLTAPSQEGQVRAMRAALQEAEMAPREVGYLNAHGTATDAGDVAETLSIREVFGADASALAVSSTKSMHGHLIGAGGALELGLALMAMQSGSIPPTANLHVPDPRCDLDYVPLVARHNCHLKAVMSNSFAFGGSNASLLVSRYDH